VRIVQRSQQMGVTGTRISGKTAITRPLPLSTTPVVQQLSRNRNGRQRHHQLWIAP
jgi:hypothetical protein